MAGDAMNGRRRKRSDARPHRLLSRRRRPMRRTESPEPVRGRGFVIGPMEGGPDVTFDPPRQLDGSESGENYQL
jgi:hypothetical protein